MKIAIAQINPTVGDFEGNIEKLKCYTNEAYEQGADIVLFPEGTITGYPLQDLLYEKSFVIRNKDLLHHTIELSPEIVVIVGFVDCDLDGNLYNSAAIYKSGKLVKTVNKTLLPTYDVFDEKRYFKQTKVEDIEPVTVNIKGEDIKIGVEICEDLWDAEYDVKVTDLLVQKGAQIIVNISASPFQVGKGIERMQLVKKKVLDNNVPFFYCNLVGGQDELVFDGQSLAFDSSGDLILYAKKFEEDFVIIEFDSKTGKGSVIELPSYNKEKELYSALVLGVSDYFRKTGFKKAIIGLSGGIDSTLVACIACDALGKDNIIGVSMPSKYSSTHSKTDAKQLADNLGICFVQLPIQKIVDSYIETLEKPLEVVRQYFRVSAKDDDSVADENIQPRVRGNCLMDFSNRLADLGILVLNTGNKTELALGYCTLYGDMTGGLGVIGDVNKIDVYKLSQYVNQKSPNSIIPQNVFVKKPSAELKEDQFDPFDFDIVSPLVDEIIENRRSKNELKDMGYPIEEIDDVYKRIRRAEYKRWQAPPCIKVTKKAFGSGWKMPIVNRYTENS